MSGRGTELETEALMYESSTVVSKFYAIDDKLGLADLNKCDLNH